MIRVVNKPENQVVITGRKTFTNFSDFIILGSVIGKKLFWGFVSPYSNDDGILDEQFCSFSIEKSIEEPNFMMEIHSIAIQMLKELNPGLQFEAYNLYLHNE